jgi:DNA-directed RNA polymerase specialized sigma24 family protein
MQSSIMPESGNFDLAEYDPRRPAVQRKLKVRASSGNGYAIPDVLLVHACRAFYQAGDMDRCGLLFEVLIIRCHPVFLKFARGLRHNPSAAEDAIAEMRLQFWKELIDPNEVFMEQNFGVYITRLAVDGFKHQMRQEGLRARGEDDAPTASRHVPAGRVESLDRPRHGDDAALTLADTVADTTDDMEQFIGNEAAKEILRFIPDKLNRTIVYLRAILKIPWAEVVAEVKMSDRMVRLRYQTALTQMRMGMAKRGDLPPGTNIFNAGLE